MALSKWTIEFNNNNWKIDKFLLGFTEYRTNSFSYEYNKIPYQYLNERKHNFV